MELENLLERCRELEDRAAGLYRGWAAGVRDNPGLCSLWTALARDEEEHARSLRVALSSPAPHARGVIDVRGWTEAIAVVEERLLTAERLGAWSTTDQLLAAALELEMTELEAMRLALVALAGRARDEVEEHGDRLAEEASRLSRDPHVRLLATLLLAKTRVQDIT